MYILRADGKLIVNTNQIDAICVYKRSDGFGIMAYRGSEESGLGTYEDEGAAMAVMFRIYDALGRGKQMLDLGNRA
ncbi:MAG: hypothetical protein LIO70_01335 [Clostridiales bacterium]|nr:hypothetical protein [Clostridiales bacterium]